MCIFEFSFSMNNTFKLVNKRNINTLYFLYRFSSSWLLMKHRIPRFGSGFTFWTAAPNTLYIFSLIVHFYGIPHRHTWRSGLKWPFSHRREVLSRWRVRWSPMSWRHVQPLWTFSTWFLQPHQRWLSRWPPWHWKERRTFLLRWDEAVCFG